MGSPAGDNLEALGSAYAALAGEAAAEHVEKRSRFVGVARPIATLAEGMAAVDALRRLHRDASHVAWACVAGPGGVERRYADDGEVAGTAGAPLLALLDRRGLRGALLAVARYYGGVKLGAGGLSRAYTRAGGLALDAAGVSAMLPGSLLEVVVDLSDVARVTHRLRLRGAQVDGTAWAERATLRLWVEGDGVALEAEISDLTAGRAAFRRLGFEHRAGG